jgi:hypothetical protein
MKPEFRMHSSRQRAGDVIVYCSNSGCTASVLVYQQLLGVTTTSRNSTGKRCDGFPHRLNLNWLAVLEFLAS